MAEDAEASLESLSAKISSLQSQVRVLERVPDHSPCTSAEFREMVDHIRNVCPLPKGCTCVCVREETDETGYTQKSRTKFTITIDKRLSRYETEHVLVHEWAHVMAWRPYHPLAGDHGPDWGVWYALVYRQYHGVK